MNSRQEDKEEIERIIREKDDLAVEDDGYILIDKYPRDEEIVELLCQIFEADWHSRHEDLALSLQGVKNPIASKSLFKVASIEFEQYKWDDNYPLQRKCTWALADIGTDEAKDYLRILEKSKNEAIAFFAAKRLKNWGAELGRKGQRLSSPVKRGFSISLEKYSDAVNNVPEDGQRIIGSETSRNRTIVRDASIGDIEHITEDYIVVYQAYKPSIAEYAVENQKLGGPDFSFSRMSWIKPNFLWMMYRCGWARKENQERVLAMWIKKTAFEDILRNAAYSSFQPEIFTSEEEWRHELQNKKVRLQWDPDHDYNGAKVKRRAVQLGLKDEVLDRFCNEQIECILDITPFVNEQKEHIINNGIEKLLVPKERIIRLSQETMQLKIGVEL